LNSAFVGFDEFYFVFAGLLLAINTFAHVIIVVVWMIGFAWIMRCNQSIDQSADQSINQSVNHSNNQSISQSINQSVGQSINLSLLMIWCLFTLRICLTMINASINQRHLMVWEIFAPKFLFDALNVLMVNLLNVAISFAVYCFTYD
jgi:hypothetical protein